MRLSRRHFLVGCLGAGAAATSAGWYGTVYEPDDIEVVRLPLTIANLPPRLDGLTAAQVSDIHVGEVSDVQRHMVDKVAALRPDLVFVTGDVVDDDVAIGDAADLLAGFPAPRGTWVVPGHRDHMAEAVFPLSQALAARQLHMMINRSVQLDDGLWIVGVDDPSSRHDDLAGALANVPNGATRILLAHSPDIVERLTDTRFDLVLAGHTHGGQVNLPLVRDGWLREASTRRYRAGLYQVGASKLYVNRGIGTYYLPIRISARPEITLLTLHAA
jgi:predicted MPP superfamily phosphohydrolase